VSFIGMVIMVGMEVIMLIKNIEYVGASSFIDIVDDDVVFKFCSFTSAAVEGVSVRLTALSCTFEQLDWYWGLFSGCLFVDTKFTDCVFSGVNFMGCRFINCVFLNCQFINDNLNQPCAFLDTHWFNCVLTDSEGLPCAG